MFEEMQTGDGRIWQLGAWKWEDPADVPLQWNPDDNSSHEGTLTFGNADRIERVENRIEAEGPFDDSLPRAEELVARMEQGLATGVSVVYDDVALQIISTKPLDESEDEGIVIMASATLRLDHRGTTVLNAPPHVARLLEQHGGVIVAAAGDPLPEESEVLFEDESDAVLYNYTRSRLRAITLVDVPAFIDARIELTAGSTDTSLDAGEEESEVEDDEGGGLVASARFPLAPPLDWFFTPEPEDDDERWVLQPDGVSYAVPLTILDSGQFYGHACYFGQCHIGYLRDCVSPPLSSDEFLARAREVDEHGVTVRPGFLTGEVVCADGTHLPIAPIVLKADHPNAYLFADEAQDEYAHTGLQWGQCRVTQSPVGVWVCGALNPDVTPEQLRVLRASALSGDWRDVPGERGAQFIAALTVSRPGFPIARAAMAASGMTVVPAEPFVEFNEEGRVVRASGLNVVRHVCAECEKRKRLGTVLSVEPDPRIDELLRLAKRLDARTAHLRTAAQDNALDRLAMHRHERNDGRLIAWRQARVVDI